MTREQCAQNTSGSKKRSQQRRNTGKTAPPKRQNTPQNAPTILHTPITPRLHRVVQTLPNLALITVRQQSQQGNISRCIELHC